MKRALITGITGQDGRYLSEFLTGKGYQVFGVVRGQNNPKAELVQPAVVPRPEVRVALHGVAGERSQRGPPVEEPRPLRHDASDRVTPPGVRFGLCTLERGEGRGRLRGEHRVGRAAGRELRGQIRHE